MPKVQKPILLLLLVFFIVSSFITFKIFYDFRTREFLTVVFLDVGQGDSIFIEAPNGFQIIVDGGPNSDVVRSLSKVIPYYDRSIDLLIASHSDSDHIAGFVDLMERFRITTYAQNFVEDEDALNSHIFDLIEEKKIDQVFLKSGDKIAIDPIENIYLEVLWPPENHLESENNDNSLIIRLVYNDISFLLTGDASIYIEENLISILKKKILAEVLKVGHHGSKTSTAPNFVKMVDPEYAVISAGKDNRFGHPHEEVIEILLAYKKSHKIKILETAVLGSIVFETDGEELWLLD